MLESGQLDNRITLRHRSLSRDGQGQQVESYATYATVWAKRADIKGREFSAAEQVTAELTVQFTIRWRSDLLSTDRITSNGQDFNIRQIIEVPRHKGLEIMATALVS